MGRDGFVKEVRVLRALVKKKFISSTLGKQEAVVKKNEAMCTTGPMCVQSLARNSWLEKQFLFSRLHVQKSRLHMQSYLTARNWEKSASRAEEDILHVLPSASR